MKLPSTVFDLHCDTLTAFMDDSPQQHGDTLNDPCHQFALCKIPRGVRFWSWGRKIAWRLALTLTGRTCPPCLDGPEKIAHLGDYLQSRGLSPALAEKILWRNALEFFQANLG